MLRNTSVVLRAKSTSPLHQDPGLPIVFHARCTAPTEAIDSDLSLTGLHQEAAIDYGYRTRDWNWSRCCCVLRMTSWTQSFPYHLDLPKPVGTSWPSSVPKIQRWSGECWRTRQSILQRRLRVEDEPERGVTDITA